MENEDKIILKIFEFTSLLTEEYFEFKILEVQIQKDEDLNEEKVFSNNCLISTNKYGGEEFCVYNSNLHLLFVFKICLKNSKEIIIENVLNFHTFSRVFSMLMTDTLILLGSTSSVHIYNWKLFLKKKSNELNLKQGRCVYLPKKVEKEQIIGILFSKN
eukprot:gene6389-10396_t